MWRMKQLSGRDTAGYVGAQCVGAVAGVLAANASFGWPFLSISEIRRDGWGLLTAEAVATFVLVLVILILVRSDRTNAIPVAVGAWVAAIVFATASTGFANPAVTFARALTESTAGIAPASIAAFIVVELVAGVAAVPVAMFLVPGRINTNTIEIEERHAVDPF
jgi:glycerol uptake facilitator-like aquaporin